MSFIRLACVSFAAAIAVFAIAFGAHAQPSDDNLPLVVEEKGARPPPQLSQTWYETEGDWQGTWTPANPSAHDGRFFASWSLGRQRERAQLQISVQNNSAVRIARTAQNGTTCDYQGFLNREGNVVTGTYSCNTAPRRMPWRASIGARIAQSDSGDRPAIAIAVPYLRYVWIEREGDWHGRWTPRNPELNNGAYDAHYAKGTESANASLQISVDSAGGSMYVYRTDPGGRTCVYHGVVSNNTLVTARGTYHCQGVPGDLPWSASLQIPGR